MGRFNNPMHNDVYHDDSAKRDTAGGVAGLDASGNIIGIGSQIIMARDATNKLIINDRNSGEWASYWIRVAANDFIGYIKSSGAFSQIQLNNMKNVALGIAGLDASSKQVPAQHFVGVPATAGAAGVAGQMAYASGHFYICVATNTWERVVIATW